MPQIYDPEPKDNAQPENKTSNEKGGLYKDPKSKGLYSGDSIKPILEAETNGRSSENTTPESNLFNPGEKAAKLIKSGSSFNFLGISVSKKKSFAGGGIMAAIIGTLVALFFILIPLKIENLVNIVQKRYFASSENAVSNEETRLFEGYVTKRVLPGYKKCGTTISKECTAIKFGTNPVSSLYNVWSQNKLEYRLANDYHIQFVKKSNGWYLRSPGISSNGDNIGSDGQLIDREFNGRSTFRQAVRANLDLALENESSWKKIMYRYKVGRLLEEKYGVKRCIIFCGISDPLKDKLDSQKSAAQLYLTQRIIMPRTNTLGIALECVLSSCDPRDTQPNGDPSSPATNGAPEDQKVDKPVSDGLKALAAQYDITDEAALKALQSQYDDISDKGFQKWLVTEGLAKFGISDGTAGAAADAIPIAGWINLVAQLVGSASNAKSELVKLKYVTNGTAAVSLFMLYRTYADEIHTGHVTATEVGSLNSSFGAANQGKSTDPPVGGSSDATGTPLYSNITGGKPKSSVASLSSLLLPSASAASNNQSNTNNYTCQNGKPVPNNKLVCSEEDIGGGTALGNSISDIINVGGGFLPAVAGIWNNSIGKLFQFAQGVFGDILGAAFSAAQFTLDASCKIPGQPFAPYCALRDEIKTQLPYIARAITNFLIPNPFGTNMSGGRKFDMMAAGADVAGNDYAHEGLGGRKLTAGESTAILNDQINKQSVQTKNEPLIARIFDKSNTSSLISKVALDVPYNFQSSTSSMFSSLLLTPFKSIGLLFSSITSSANADNSTVAKDPFTIPQYGYTQADINNIGDAENYWDKYCVDDPSSGYQKDNSYNISAAGAVNADPETGTPLNKQTNPCMLIKATVGDAGGKYDTSLLTQDDQADINSGSTAGTSSPTGNFVNPFPDGWIPGRLDMGYDGTFTKKIVSPCDGKVIYKIYSSGPHSWEGYYFVVQCSQSIPDLPSNAFFFAEGLTPTINQNQQVTANQQIAVTGPTGFSEGPGGIEWGLADPKNPGNALAESGVNGMSNCSSASATMVNNFAKWVEQNLKVAKPSTTDHAGCA